MQKIFAAAIVVAALAAPLGAQGRRLEVIEQVLVKVNGDIITKTELEARQIEVLRGRMKQDIDQAALKNDEQLKKALAEITPRILVDAIDELLIVQLAKERGYKLRDEQFRDWLANLRKEQNLEDDQRFQQALRQEGMSVDDLRKNVERQFMISQIQRDEVGSKLTITEEEARQYYLTHQQEFVTTAKVTLREILLTIPASTQKGQAAINVAAEDEGRANANAIRGRLLKGEDFAKVASEVSESGSKANGGLIGPFEVSQLSEQLQKLLQSMKPGEITPPIRVSQGFQILKLETLEEAAQQSFDSVRDIVAERVHSARQRQEMRRFLTRVRSQALIEWKNAELKKAYEQSLAETSGV